MGMLIVAQRQDKQSSQDYTPNPAYSAALQYFSAGPTVHTAASSMSGLSKTHGFAIPTGLNVNSQSKRRRR